MIADARERMSGVRLLLIWPGRMAMDATLAGELAAAGVGAIEYRPEPGETDREAGRALQGLAGHGAVALVNNRVSLALLVDGVHLGEADMAVAAARAALGSGAVIGRTARSGASLAQGFTEGADYVAVGAVAASALKPDAPVLGPQAAGAVAAGAPGPVFAVGGAKRRLRGAWAAAGFTRVALSGAVLAAADPVAAAADWAAWLATLSRWP
ncbi:thiamine phosphate synthase [bacterium]|nr:thiamine phosphate synthase [bacterium]